MMALRPAARLQVLESVDLELPYHVQTVLAYELNDSAAGQPTARRCAFASSASSATSNAST